MADETPQPPPPPPPALPPGPADGNGDRVEPLNIEEELRDSYLRYALTVIHNRALPDVRDGLKPSQRRILVAMNDLNLGPTGGRMKCAKICGDTSGNYHPHGEAIIYPTLVRMAQDWNMRYVLVDKQGNFGTIAPMPPAAMRYCVTGDTLVRTPHGTRRIRELAEIPPNSEADVSLEVLNRDGRTVTASKLFHCGDHPTFRLRVREGHELTGTDNHPVLCLEPVDGVPTLCWRLMRHIQPGTTVALLRQTQELPAERLAEEDRQLALLAGAWVAEGFASSGRAGFNNCDRAYFDQVLSAFDAVVGGVRYISERTIKSGNRLLEIDIHNLGAFTTSPLGEMIGLRSADKCVPSFVWGRSLAFKRVFLQSLYEGDGSSSLLARNTLSIAYSTRSRRLAHEVQQLLLEFGVVARQARYDNGEIKVFISNRRDARLFARRVGFLGVKQEKLETELARVPTRSRSLSGDFVPHIAEYVRRSAGSTWTSADWLRRHNIDRVERWEQDGQTIRGHIACPTVKATIAPLVAGDYYFAEVTDVEPAGLQAVYSIRVDAPCHSFITNGFVSHNTEARLSAVAAEMLADLDQDTVDMMPTYDGRLVEPTVLPSKFPNLVVNGCDGIAVGMATQIPPHNLRDVCGGLILLIDQPEATIEQLMEHIPHPDFPTGGLICGRTGVYEGYRTGRGKLILRARADINEEGPVTQIIIREVPYQQTRGRVTTAIADLVKEERIKGIKALRDESSERMGEPVRLVIDLKKGEDPHLILNQLYQFTPLQDTVSLIFLALVDGQPRTLPLKQMLEEFLRHRVRVVRRRTEYKLREAKRRAHILEGQLIAISSLDEVINICRRASSRAAAKQNLQELAVAATLLQRALGDTHFAALEREIGTQAAYSMSEAQADAVVRLQLGQLAALERDEIFKEYNGLREEIVRYEDLLSTERNILAAIRAELTDLRDRFGDDRKTEIIDAPGEVLPEDLIQEEDNAVTISHNGYIKRLPLNTYRTQHRGGKGVSGGAARDDDFVEHFFVASTHAYLLIFTNRGQLYWLKVYHIPQMSRTSIGRAIANVLSLKPDEKVSSVIPVRRFDDVSHLLMATRRGLVKKTALSEYSRPKAGGIIGISLDEGDTLIDVVLTKPTDEVVLCTKQGLAIRFDEADARAMGRNTRGVKGITLQANDEVVGMVVADPEGYLLTICENGYGKRTPFGPNTAGVEVGKAEGEEPTEEAPAEAPAEDVEGEGGDDRSAMRYRKQRRGGKGVRDIRTSERNGAVVDVTAVRNGGDIMVITMQGMVNRTHVDEIRVVGRNTQGVRIMNLREGDRVTSLAKLAREEEVPPTNGAAPEEPPTNGPAPEQNGEGAQAP